MRIRFLREYRIKDGSGTVYQEGQEIEVNAASARHYINRAVAIEVPAPPKASPKPPAEPAPVNAPRPTPRQRKLKSALTDDAP